LYSCGIRLRVNQVADRFGLRKIHLAVLAGPQCELAWTCEPSIQSLDPIQEFSENHR
jgi:hypothetical protein